MKILLYVSDRPGLKGTVRLVRHLVEMTGAELTLMASFRTDREIEVRERLLSKVVKHLKGLPARTRVRKGTFKAVVMHELLLEEFDLFVAGYSQLSKPRRRQLSALLREALQHTRTDILVAKASRPTLERVLICTSGARLSSDPVKTGAWFTSAVGAQATLLHVTSSVPSMYTGLDQLDETLPELLDSATPLAEELRHEAKILENHQVGAELKLRRGAVAEEILREAVRGEHDLIVLGATSQEGIVRGFLMGDMVRQILDRAETSVLVISHAESTSTGTRSGTGS